MRYLLILLLAVSMQARSQDLTLENTGLQPPVRLNCTSVKDQSNSSTCWSFSAVSFLESEMMRQHIPVADLSEMFVARYSYIRKIERHLALKGGNFFTPGGQFHDVVWVLKNYGIMPESAYPGKPIGVLNHNHAELDTIISRFVNKLVRQGVTALDSSQKGYVNKVLDIYLGPVPAQFVYQQKNYTPKTFMAQVVKLDPDDFVELTSYTHHPFGQWFVLEDKYNWTGDAYYNVPLSDFRKITDTALAMGYTLGWDGDADDPDFLFMEGLAYLPGSISDEVKARQDAFKTQTTLLDHMMHIVDAVKDNKGKTWYYIKNSWGNINPIGGFMYMREDYFYQRTLAVIVHKKMIAAITGTLPPPKN
ncbi:MAG: aminopeptidase [Chitinophagaceae bacterium]|nr:aminopeptidase [Chitinophagaceae bacterium]